MLFFNNYNQKVLKAIFKCNKMAGKQTPKEKLLAILKTLELARTIQQNYPEIAEMYQEGGTHREIAKKLGVQATYRVSDEVAKQAVGIAIRGYRSEGFGVKSFGGLLNPEKSREIGREHQREVGLSHIVNGTSIFGLSGAEVRLNAAQGGQAAYSNGSGFHGFNGEQRVEAARKGVEVRGDILWKSGEYESVSNLAGRKEFQHSDGRIKWAIIAQQVNSNYYGGGKIRTPNALRAKYRIETRRLESP